MKRLLSSLLVAVLAFAPACATTGPRHTATVAGLTSGAVLDVIQDTELRVVCGRVGAPEAPACVTPELHKAISLKLGEAYGLHRDLMEVIRAVPADQQPPEVMTLVAKISALVNDILALLPSSKQKAELVESVVK